MDFKNLIEKYGDDKLPSSIQDAFNIYDIALSTGKLSLLYEFNNILSENTEDDDEDDRPGDQTANQTGSALEPIAASIIGGLAAILAFLNFGKGGAGKFAEVTNAAASNAAEALQNANQDLDTLHKIIKLANGDIFITYYTNMDALKGTGDALTGIIIKTNKVGDFLRALFTGHKPARIIKCNGVYLQNNGVDIASVKGGTVEIIAGSGAQDITNTKEGVNALKWGYTNLEGMVRDLPMETFHAEMDKAIETALQKQIMVSDGARLPSIEDLRQMTDGEKAAFLEQKAQAAKQAYTQTEFFKGLNAKSQAEMLDRANAKIQISLEQVLPGQKIMLNPPPSAEALEAVKSGKGSLLKIDGTTSPKGNTGLELAKSKVSMTDIWLAGAGITNFAHNLLTYFTRKKKEPKQIAAMFTDAFDPIKIVLVGIWASMLGNSLEGTANSGSYSFEESAYDDQIGSDESGQAAGTEDPQTSTTAESYIYKLDLKDFLFENKTTYKR